MLVTRPLYHKLSMQMAKWSEKQSSKRAYTIIRSKAKAKATKQKPGSSHHASEQLTRDKCVRSCISDGKSFNSCRTRGSRWRTGRHTCRPSCCSRPRCCSCPGEVLAYMDVSGTQIVTYHRLSEHREAERVDVPGASV